MNGTCYTAEECAERDGTASGSCADGYGVCCIIEVSCGGRTSENCTYLTQTPSASPAVDSDDLDDQCSYTICPRTSSVNRIRLEFATFMLAPPIAPATMDGQATGVDNQDFAIGKCNTDSFSVGNSPVICGVNDGQHMVVDTDGTDCVTALFTFGSGTVMRGYNIHVLQFEITNEMGGPPGCLQFFTGAEGIVSTFNWQAPATSTHLANQNYDVCVRKLADRCVICWSPITSGVGDTGPQPAGGPAKQTLGSFGINNGGFSADGEGKSGQGVAKCAGRTALQVKEAPDTGDSDDFIIIPLGIPPGANNDNIKAGGALNTNTVATGTIGDSLFCGRCLNAFDAANAAGTNFDGTVCSRVTPFTLGVRFDDREATGSTELRNAAAASLTPAAGEMQAKLEVSSQHSNAGNTLSEPLGTAGFSLGFAQIAC